MAFSGNLAVKESDCQRKRLGFYPWVRKIPWRKKWQLTPVFLPGKSPRQRSLASYSPWGHKRVGHDLVTKQQQQSRITGKKNFPTSAIPAGRSGPGPPVCPPQSTEGQPHLPCGSRMLFTPPSLTLIFRQRLDRVCGVVLCTFFICTHCVAMPSTVSPTRLTSAAERTGCSARLPGAPLPTPCT